jgi:hypothetical protein
MLAQNYFTTDTVVSPVETNENVEDINGEDLVYDYDNVGQFNDDGEFVLWDTEFRADVSSATATNKVHNSYAHQALCGQRPRLKWHSAATPSDVIISNRGPECSVAGDGTLIFDDGSNTLEFHGEKNVWKGTIVLGDGSVRLAESYLPDGISYQPLNGMPLGPDHIFLTDWTEVEVGTAPPGMPSGDNWMVICNQVINENEINVVWD